MDYTNPKIPEGINTSKEHPLKDFFILSLGVITCIIVAVFTISLLAEKFAGYIPFSIEKELTNEFISPGETDSERQNYLESIVDNLKRVMDLPDDMSITIHYVDDNVENAFATLGGHIFIHRGLFELLPHENALTMVIAHEMAHIQHRHPIIAMGRGVVIGLLLATVAGLSSDMFVGEVVNSAGMITILNFSREQEKQSDRTAITALQNHYGHVNGAIDFFKVLLNLEKQQLLSVPQFFSTHPLSEKRIYELSQLAVDNGWLTNRPVTPLLRYYED